MSGVLRRKLRLLGRGARRPLALLALASALGCMPADEPEQAALESINLMILGDARIKGPIMSRVPDFEKKYHIKVNFKPVEKLGTIFKTSQSPYHDVDVALGLNLWVGDFVNNGFIDPLDDYIDRDKAMSAPASDRNELAFDDILAGVVLKNEWGGRIYSMICDNDNMFLIYRKDVLEDPKNQADFLAANKHALPNPPATIDELIEVATFFKGRDWNHDGLVNERGFAMDRTGDDSLMYFYALAVTTPYTVMPEAENARHGLPRGLFLFQPDMAPLVRTPGFKLGVAKWLQLAALSLPTATRQSVIDEIVGGRALMAIDWGDTGPASLGDKSLVRGKLGYALPPGTRSYYDWVDQKMVPTPDVHYAPLQEANGFAFYMTSTSQHKEAAWKFIRFMNSPAVSIHIVTDRNGGYQPWRTSHNDVNQWVAAEWKEHDATQYVDTIRETSNHENVSLDLRIPGISDYGHVIEQHLLRLLEAATPNIDAEMEACATELEMVTDNNQREAQRAAYRAHLGLNQPP